MPLGIWLIWDDSAAHVQCKHSVSVQEVMCPMSMLWGVAHPTFTSTVSSLSTQRSLITSPVYSEQTHYKLPTCVMYCRAIVLDFITLYRCFNVTSHSIITKEFLATCCQCPAENRSAHKGSYYSLSPGTAWGYAAPPDGR